jgi:glyoxylase-like metal-dependent hydrolase (beta-lactamase superfamily II)
MIKSTPYADVLQITLCKYPEMMPGTFVSAYWVDGLLIDAGLAYTAEELTDFLMDKQLNTVVNTHHHEDHIGANKQLQDRYGVEVFAPPLAVDKINQLADLYPYQAEVWGYPIPSVVKPLGNQVRTAKYSFEMIQTPGHDRDHVCFFDSENGRLFSGDLFLGTKPSRSRPMEDNWQIIEDLKQVKALNPRIIFSASGMVINDPRPRLDAVISALENIGGKVREFHHQGMTSKQIMKRIFGEESPMAETTQFQFSSENMVKCFL